MNVIHNVFGDYGDNIVTAVRMYQEFQDASSTLGLLNALMVWAKLQESSECFVGAYLSVGILPGLKKYM